MKSTYTDMAASLLLKGTLVAASFAQSVLLARWMAADQFGVFVVGLGLAMALGTMATFGQQTAVIRFLPPYLKLADHSHARGLVRFGYFSVLTAATTMVAILLAFYALFHSLLPAVWAPLVYAVPLMFVWALSEYSMGLLRAQGSVVFSSLPRDVLWRFTLLAICFAIMWQGRPVSATLVFQVSAGILAIAVFVQAAVSHQWLKASSPGPARLKPREWAAASVGIWVATSLSTLSTQIETPLAGFVLSPETAGGFFVIQRVAGLVTIVLMSMGIFYGSRFSALINSGDRAGAQKFTTQINLVILALSLPVFLCTVIWPGMVLSIFGPDYEGLDVPLRILAGGFLVDAAFGPVGIILLVTGHAAVHARIIALTLVFKITVLVVGSAVGGLLGAALASSLARIVTIIWLAVEIYKRTGIISTLVIQPRRQMQTLRLVT
jgi:O-antigen/teichoic acid export membrane protein